MITPAVALVGFTKSERISTERFKAVGRFGIALLVKSQSRRRD